MSGKRKRVDVAEFASRFTDRIVSLHQELETKTYRHGGYQEFRVNDPKPRHIHKASVGDRLVHHAIYRALYPYFDRQFIYDSYSCRVDKGTHRAIDRFCAYGRRVSQNATRTAWVLKCDIRKFFASIDHRTLKEILAAHISDADTLWLLYQVIDSFHTPGTPGVGLPLGNLTSQLLVNIYMNEFDQFVKRALKVRYYIRYADDFVFIHEDRGYLEHLLPKIGGFLEERLGLSLHPQKVSICTLDSGVDFLGWIHFSHHRVLRASTRRRMMRRIVGLVGDDMVASYLGLLKHGNTLCLRSQLIFEFSGQGGRAG